MKTTINSSNSGSTTTFDPWSEPQRIEVHEYLDSIEFIYKQTSMVTNTIYPSSLQEERVYKIVFSVVEGKWHKSEPIFGTITSARDEYYSFEY